MNMDLMYYNIKIHTGNDSDVYFVKLSQSITIMLYVFITVSIAIAFKYLYPFT
jgi:hypothetical protein